MLIGLRKAWSETAIREEPLPYRAESASDSPRTLFHHENLEVYRRALQFMNWLVVVTEAVDLPNRLFRQIDETATSIVLNVAEGNGRFADLDHRRFLQMAQSAATKAGVCIDLCVQRVSLARRDVDVGKRLLHEISAMLAGF